MTALGFVNAKVLLLHFNSWALREDRIVVFVAKALSYTCDQHSMGFGQIIKNLGQQPLASDTSPSRVFVTQCDLIQ